MKEDFVNSFLAPARLVWEKELGQTLDLVNAQMVSNQFTTDDLTAVIGISGRLHGNVLYGFSEQTTHSIVSAILGDESAEVSSEIEAALETFGHDIGIAFQLIDDLLDYAADPDELGKQIGADLREGKMTYPLIHLLEHGSPDERTMALRALGDAEETQACLGEVTAAMRRVGSFDATREVAIRYAEQARTALAVLPASEARDALGELPDFVVTRGH